MIKAAAGGGGGGGGGAFLRGLFVFNGGNPLRVWRLLPPQNLLLERTRILSLRQRLMSAVCLLRGDAWLKPRGRSHHRPPAFSQVPRESSHHVHGLSLLLPPPPLAIAMPP